MPFFLCCPSPSLEQFLRDIHLKENALKVSLEGFSPPTVVLTEFHLPGNLGIYYR